MKAPLTNKGSGNDKSSTGSIADAFNVLGVLKSCANQRDLGKGSNIHAYIQEHTCLNEDPFIASSLVSMYARCGTIVKAQQVLEELPVRNVAVWTALIAACVQQGLGQEALKYFEDMQLDGHSPNAITFTCVLKACGSIGAAAKGEQIHEKIVSLGLLKKNIVLGNTLVDMYARCGSLDKARQVLEELPFLNVVTWNVVIAGYVQHRQGEEALKCFDSMQSDGHIPNVITFTSALKACGCIGAAAKGEEIHDKIVRLGLLEKDIVLGSALVDMYARCGALSKARQVLEELPVRDVISWTTLISRYAQQGQGEEALKCFDSMEGDGHSPDAFTFTCALKACGSIGAAVKGEEIHNKIVSLGMLEENVVLGSILVDMYARCGSLAKAQQVLEELPVRNVVTWNALITGYAQQEQGEDALKCFDSMQHDGHSPDAVTFTCALKACGSIGAATKGKEIHDKLVSLGMLKKHPLLGNTLVDMYARCGMLAKARQVLAELPVRDVVSWTVLLAGYAQHGQGEEALKCFDSMEHDNHSPNPVSFTYALKACASIGAIAKGKQIHNRIVSLGMLEKNITLGNTLVDMYVRCGALSKAQEVLEVIPLRDVVTWTVLIVGYALQGQSVELVECFEKMQSKGVKPDSTTLICVFNACSHSGLSDKAEMLFSVMSTEYDITQSLEHYCCMVDLFGRAGEFDKALDLIKGMPSAEHLPVWVALLGACRKWGEVKIGRLVFERVLQINKNDGATYVCMASIYTAAGMQEEAERIDIMRRANRAFSVYG